MTLQQNEILHNARTILKQVPYRTKFERENFLYAGKSGPKLLVLLCLDIETLNVEYTKATNEWERDAVLNEMNVIALKIDEVKGQIGDNVTQAIEDADSAYWVEELARQAAVEALCQKTSVDTMGQMLKLPSENYEEAITKCQHFLNIINKVTRVAERKANLVNVPQAMSDNA